MRVRVFPEPAPARTRAGPRGEVTALNCSGLRSLAKSRLKGLFWVEGCIERRLKREAREKSGKKSDPFQTVFCGRFERWYNARILTCYNSKIIIDGEEGDGYVIGL